MHLADKITKSTQISLIKKTEKVIKKTKIKRIRIATLFFFKNKNPKKKSV